MRREPLFQGVNSDLEINTPQVNVNILREQASQWGITATDIETAVSLCYSGNLISLIQTAIDQYNVILELYPRYQQQADTLNEIWLRSPFTSDLVPLSATAQWEEGLGSNECQSH